MKKLLLFLAMAVSLQAQVSTQKVNNTAMIRNVTSPISSASSITASNLTANGTMQFVPGAGSGKIIQSDASGFFSWVSASFGDWFSNSNNTQVAGVTNTFNGGNNFSSNGFRINTSQFYNIPGDSFDINNPLGFNILMLATNGNTFFYSPGGNFAGFQLILSNGVFVNNSVLRMQGNAGEGQLGFGTNPTLGTPSWTFAQQVFITNSLTVAGSYTGIGSNPRMFLNRTVNAAGAGGEWITWQDDPTGNNWSMGQTTNAAAHLSIRSGSTSPYTGAEEIGIDVGQVTVSNNFYVGGTITYPKGITGSVTNSQVTGGTNIEVFASGILTNVVRIPP